MKNPIAFIATKSLPVTTLEYNKAVQRQTDKRNSTIDSFLPIQHADDNVPNNNDGVVDIRDDDPAECDVAGTATAGVDNDRVTIGDVSNSKSLLTSISSTQSRDCSSAVTANKLCQRRRLSSIRTKPMSLLLESCFNDDNVEYFVHSRRHKDGSMSNASHTIENFTDCRQAVDRIGGMMDTNIDNEITNITDPSRIFSDDDDDGRSVALSVMKWKRYRNNRRRRNVGSCLRVNPQKLLENDRLSPRLELDPPSCKHVDASVIAAKEKIVGNTMNTDYSRFDSKVARSSRKKSDEETEIEEKTDGYPHSITEESKDSVATKSVKQTGYVALSRVSSPSCNSTIVTTSDNISNTPARGKLKIRERSWTRATRRMRSAVGSKTAQVAQQATNAMQNQTKTMSLVRSKSAGNIPRTITISRIEGSCGTNNSGTIISTADRKIGKFSTMRKAKKLARRTDQAERALTKARLREAIFSNDGGKVSVIVSESEVTSTTSDAVGIITKEESETEFFNGSNGWTTSHYARNDMVRYYTGPSLVDMASDDSTDVSAVSHTTRRSSRKKNLLSIAM